MRSGFFWFLVFAVALGGLIAYLISNFPGALDGPGDKANLIYLVLLGLLVGSSIIGFRGLRQRGALRSLSFAARAGTVWVVIAVVLVLGYSYRRDLGAIKDRILGELAPASPIATGAGQIAVRAGPRGHFYIDAQVNGRPVRFLVDTGASDIVLSPADARRIGFDPGRLAYTRIYSTANGTVRGAPVTLGSLALGPLRLTDVPASVNGAPMSGSLLGQTFLRRLKGYSVRNGVLTLNY
ncbi:MAG TPA: TIGR02281 family clan AA aspartic protease [Alphaproteobacteria bacterium]|nr:TIGR02281 family clan AA aspartic protease [Alphaproteobacteria bacterium]